MTSTRPRPHRAAAAAAAIAASPAIRALGGRQFGARRRRELGGWTAGVGLGGAGATLTVAVYGEGRRCILHGAGGLS